MKNYKLILASSAAAIAVLPGLAQAQIDTITVTARKVEESIQTAPVAVSAFDADGIEKRQFTEVSNIGNLVPNLQISSSTAQPGNASFFIRGQGQIDGLIAVDQSVGTYVDGVYAARSTGGNFELVDVERIEVLRGAQGTLFGRNTTGGAVQIISKKPSTEDVSASAEVGYGNYDAIRVKGHLNLPVSDVFAVRVAGQYRDHEGYGTNLFDGSEIGGTTSKFVKASALFEPTDSLSFLIQGDYTDFESQGDHIGLRSTTDTPASGALTGLCAGVIPPLAPLAPLCPFAGDPFTPGSGFSIGDFVNGSGAQQTGDFYDVFLNSGLRAESESYGVALTIELELNDNFSVKSITGYRGVSLDADSDNDGTPYIFTGSVPEALAPPGLPSGNLIDQDQFSQEVQFIGSSFDSALTWIAGIYFFKEDGTDRSFTGSLFPVPSATLLTPFVSIVDGEVDNQSFAVFGQATYNLTDNLSITGGLRWTQDKRDLVLRNRSVSTLVPGLEVSNLGPSIVDGDPSDPFRATFANKFDYLSYSGGIEWQPTEGVFLYAKTARAQRSGGLNTRAQAGGLPPISFEPEEVTDYEIGGKLDFLDNRARINVAGFYTDYQNAQRNVIGVGPGGSLLSGVVNAGEATVKGIELEALFAPFEGFTIGGSLGLLDFEYDVFINPVNGDDLRDAPIQYSPELSFSISGDYERQLSGGLFNLHVDYGYKGEFFITPPTPLVAAGLPGALTPAERQALFDTARSDGYGVINARASWSPDDTGLTFTLWAKNLGAKEYITRGLGLENLFGTTTYLPGAPRTFGGSIKFNYN